MPLQESEITAGAIAYFDAQVLNRDSSVTKYGDPVTRTGPTSQFVCYKLDGDTASWTPLTGTAKTQRIVIDPSWLTDAGGKELKVPGALGRAQAYLQDGKNAYVGPKSAFVRAATREAIHGGVRPYIDPTGVAEVLAAVAARGGPV